MARPAAFVHAEWTRRPKPRLFARLSAWHPSFEFVNAVEPHTRFDSELRVKPNGSVTYTYRLAATLSNRYLLRPFPFDTQTVQMDLQPFIANAGELSLEAAPESGISDEAYTPDCHSGSCGDSPPS